MLRPQFGYGAEAGSGGTVGISAIPVEGSVGGMPPPAGSLGRPEDGLGVGTGTFCGASVCTAGGRMGLNRGTFTVPEGEKKASGSGPAGATPGSMGSG